MPTLHSPLAAAAALALLVAARPATAIDLHPRPPPPQPEPERATEVPWRPICHAAVHAGAYVPVSSDLARFSTGWSVDLGGGCRLVPGVPGLTFGVSIGRTSLNGPPPPGATEGTPDTEIALYPILVSVRGDLPFGRLRPFLSLAAGAPWVTVNAQAELAGPLGQSWSGLGRQLAAGGGLLYQADERTAFGVDARYDRVRASHDGTLRLDGVGVNAVFEHVF
jgi:hypothetical protein